VTKQRELRQAMCGLNILDNNNSAKQVGETIMREECTKEIGDISLIDYATTTDSVYIWMTNRVKLRVAYFGKSVIHILYQF
jgi:hypothetical protein